LKGRVRVWNYGFSVHDGHPRYIGVNGMARIPQILLSELDSNVTLMTGFEILLLLPPSQLTPLIDTKVNSISLTDSNQWKIHTTSAAFDADVVLACLPPSQALPLLQECGIPPSHLSPLHHIHYDPTISIQFELNGESAIPLPGGLSAPHKLIHFLCDNYKKGISKHHTVTAHCSAECSREYSQREDCDIINVISEVCQGYFGSSSVMNATVLRWRDALPTVLHNERCHVAIHPGGRAIVFSGDAYVHARVEGAWLSGIAAAKEAIKLMNKL
jgi:predicted NAD/FAD-dependent oxidoreductase